MSSYYFEIILSILPGKLRLPKTSRKALGTLSVSSMCSESAGIKLKNFKSPFSWHVKTEARQVGVFGCAIKSRPLLISISANQIREFGSSQSLRDSRIIRALKTFS